MRYQIKPVRNLFVGCAILLAAGCGKGGGGDSSAGNGVTDEPKEFAPGGVSVDTGKQSSRFDLAAGNSNGQSVPTPTNKSAGIGFGNVVGVCDHWANRGPTRSRSAETEFEILSDSPDVIPPFNWSVQVDPLPEPVEFAPKKKNQKITIPPSKVRRPSGNGIAFSPVPTGVVTVGHNEAAKDKREIWNLMTGEKVATISDVGVATTNNVVSPQGGYFAGVMRGQAFAKTIGIYDVEAGEPLSGINLDRAPFFAGIAIPREDLIVAGFTAGDKLLQAWTLPDCQPAFEVTVSTTRKPGLPAFSPGGNYIAVARSSDDIWSRSQTITMYSMETGLPEGHLEMPDYEIGWYLGVKGMAFSPDGKEFAALLDGWYCSKILIWNVEDGTIVDHLTFKKKLGEELLGRFAFSKNNVPLMFFPGKQRLLAYESGIIDRESGAGVWKLPVDDLMEKFPGTRWPLDESHVTLLSAVGRNGYVQVYKLPEDKIAKSKQQMERIASRKPRVPNHVVQAGPLTPLDRTTMRQVKAGETSWKVQSGVAYPPATGGGTVKLALPRGSLRQVMLSRTGDAQAFALRSSGRQHRSRLPAGNVKPEDLRRARSLSKPDDDATIESAGGSSKSRAWIDVYDLASNKRVRELRLTYDGDMLSSSPDGKAVLVLAAGTEGRLDSYSTETGEHLGGWEPFQGSLGENGQMVVSATMPNDTQIVALSGSGELKAWNRSTGQATFVAYNASQPTCSPDGQYVGYSDGESFYLVSLATGELSGKIPDTGDVRAAAFHPSAPKLALLSLHKGGYYLFTTNLQNGQVDAPFPVPVISAYLRWFGDRYVLLDNQKLVDTQQRVVVWSYNLPTGNHVPVSPDDRHWFVSDVDNAPVLSVAELPDGQALAQIGSGLLQPEFVLQPGGSCTLVIQANHAGFSTESRQELEKNVREQLAANRIGIAPGQDIKLVITVTETVGETVQRRYSSFGAGFNAKGQEVSLTDRRTEFRAAFMAGDVSAWDWKSSRSLLSNSYFVSRKKDESITQAIEKAYTNSLKHGFTGLILPPFVFTPKSANGLGTTEMVAR